MVVFDDKLLDLGRSENLPAIEEQSYRGRSFYSRPCEQLLSEPIDLGQTMVHICDAEFLKWHHCP